MNTSTGEMVSAEAKATRTNATEKPITRARRNRTTPGEEDSDFARYFLAKATGDGGIPTLDREVASESEALVEALRLGVTYYAIQEFRVIPDFAGRRPQLLKEAIRGK